MTKKDFIAFADMVKGLNLTTRDRKNLALKFCTILEARNPRFDRARFLDACGVPTHD